MESESSVINGVALDHLKSWVGKAETLSDTVTAAPVRALSATLDREDPEPVSGTELPALWHWLYFLPHQRQSGIGPDGHPMRGGFLPPVPLPRRMWGGGRLQWEAANPLRVGDAIQRVSRIVSVVHKPGRSGQLVFVLVQHEICNQHGLALTEQHDIVYRSGARPGDFVPPPVPAASGAAWQRELVPGEVLLFRYSALTFNGHRIHYDRRYVTEVETYPGLVVHGPLIATLLVDLVRRQAPQAQLRSFDFKAVRPSFDGRPLHLNGQASADGGSVRLWARDHDGWLTMQASATLA